MTEHTLSDLRLRALKDELWVCGAEAFTKWDELDELEAYLVRETAPELPAITKAEDGVG